MLNLFSQQKSLYICIIFYKGQWVCKYIEGKLISFLIIIELLKNIFHKKVHLKIFLNDGYRN